MRILVTGSHGLIGSALVPVLARAGHDVVRLVRGPAGPGEISWDPAAGVLDGARLSGIDGAVHLAGEGIADKRWSSARKQRILESRTRGTALLSRRLAEAPIQPSVLVSGSAVGYYGNRGDEAVDEDSPPGTGFLADVCRQWEAATAPAEAAGIRVVHARTGIVLSTEGGVLKKQLGLFKSGLGGKLGTGRQYQSWISVDDEVGAITHALVTSSLSGPVNLTAPHPVTNAELTETLGAVLHRPTVMSAPGFGLSLALGRELAEELLLSGQRVLPKKLEASGYSFQHPDLENALRVILKK